MTSSSSSPSMASCADGDPPACGDAIGADHHLVHHPVVDGGEELLLRPDVVVEGALAETVDRAQLRDAGGVVAASREDLRRGVDDRVATRLPLRAALGRRSAAVTRTSGIDRTWVGTATEGCGMNEHSFEGRVAVVTGAGRGIGRAYARAARRARRAASSSTTSAARWRATARTPDRRPRSPPRSSPRAASRSPTPATWPRVGGRTGARRRRGRALRTHRRPDQQRRHHALGGHSRKSTPTTSSGHLAVHVGGSFNTTRAAWPHMVEQSYGRIVMTTSAGLFGLPNNLAYATAKGARHRAHAQPHDRRRRARHQGQPHRTRPRSRAWPACHRGRWSAADGAGPRRADGRVPRARGLPGQRRDLRRRRGPLRRASSSRRPRATSTRTATPTIEDVAEHWATINDETGYYVPADLTDWSAAFMAHL